MSDQIDNVSVGKKANVYFGGKCISHSVFFADGTRKTVGVVLADNKLTFNVGVPELMEICGGTCEVKIAGESDFKTYAEGSSFSIAANSSFDIQTGAEAVDFVCSYG
ncbi:MAG: pyrimidine/purine nucleoside phosphorylase [Gallionellaceae bacterium]